MGSENQQYLDQLQGVDLTISESAIEHLGEIMGKDLWRTPTEEEIQIAKRWVESPLKRGLERVSALVIAKAGGEVFVNWMKNRVERIDKGNSGTYEWEVGFFLFTSRFGSEVD